MKLTNFSRNSHSYLLKNIEKYIMEVLNVEGKGRKLKVISIEMPNMPEDNYREQKNCKVEGLTLKDKVFATLELSGEDGVIDRKKINIMDLPRVTKRGTYIVKGSEYSFPLQKRLLTGVYTNQSKDGVTAWLNSGKGVNLKITLREKKKDFVLEVQNSTINLTAVLIGLGYTQEQLVRAWGRDVFQTNLNSRGARNIKAALQKLYSKLQYKKGEPLSTVPELRSWIISYFEGKDKELGHEGSELDSENVEITLGKKFSKISPEVLFEVTRKILRVYSGEEGEDNKESLIHNHIKDISDFVIERLKSRQYRSSIKRTIAKGMRSYDDLRRVVPKKIFNGPVESTFTQTALARAPKQNNPMDEISDFTEVTVRGEGGITSMHQIKNDVRAIDPSHFAFLDPLHTPEGENIGTTTHLASSVIKEGGELKALFRDVKTGKDVYMTPRQVRKAKIAFKESYKNKKLIANNSGKVKVMNLGKIMTVSKNQVTHVMLTGSQMFDTNSLAIPFLSHNNGTRGMTAAKMQTQAKPLVYREEPLVQCRVSENSDKTIEEVVGSQALAKSPVDGVVQLIKSDMITIKSKDGKKHEVGIRHNFWKNDSYDHDEPVVKVGDKVKKGQILVESNYTKNGKLALGTNLRTAYIAYKGYNFEDGVVVSESGAKKLTSMHGHQYKVDIYDEDVLNKKKYVSYFPTSYNKAQLDSLDEFGVVKIGTKVNKGDPLVVKMKRVKEDSLSKKLKNVSKLLVQDYRDTGTEWKKKTQGVVAEVFRRRKDIFIVVKTEEKAKIGDKIVGRYGNKGTITSIISDNEMPSDEEGKPMDLLLNPIGVAGRMNMGQILETTVSKSCKKNGEVYKASAFGDNHTELIANKLKKEGLKDHGTLYDPIEDKKIDGVLHGHQYIFKMEHQVEKKLSARGAGLDERYSQVSGQPARGDSRSGQAVGVAEIYALLAHGADTNLQEMFSFKGDKNMEAWRAIENNTLLPEPEVPASSQKFVSMLHGMGVNLTEDGKNVKMKPFLDKDVKQLSHGEIKDALRLRGKDLKEEKGGLFDIKTTGGIIGDKYSHVKLKEPTPHPTFEKSILSVLGITSTKFNDIMSSKSGVLNGEIVSADAPGAKTGGIAIKEMLSKIDVGKRIKEIAKIAPTKKGTELNKLNAEARVLRNFKDNNIKLTDMVVEHVPVIPPKFRSIIELPNGSLQVADVNEHYSALILANNQTSDLKKRPGLRDEYHKNKKDVYEAFKGVTGFGPGILEQSEAKGLSKTVAGSAPKFGWFQSKMLKRRQDVSARGVVSPDPKLDMDVLGVPENMAWNMFSPFVRKELKSRGMTSLRAKKEVDDKTSIALDALKKVMSEKHIFMNRAPTLHRHGMMAFRPKLVAGSAIKVPVEAIGGFNMDFDGDTAALHVVVSKAANDEAKKALPSKNIYQPGRTKKLVPEFGFEYILGLYKLTKPGRTTANKYLNKERALKDFDQRKIRLNDIISVKLLGRTTAGIILVNEYLPEKIRDYQLLLDKGGISKKLKEVDKVSGREKFKATMTEWKHLGRKYSYLTGSSLLLSDLKLLSKKRNQLYFKADRQVEAIKRNRSLTEEKKKEKILDVYRSVDSKIISQIGSLSKNDAGKDNNIADMANMGVSKPGVSQVKQLVGHLGLLMDHKQQIIMEPVRGNYGEGLSSADYWAHSYSQRKGMIDKSRSVSGPGMLSKELNNASVNYSISEPDCRTSNGRMETVDRHIIDRFMATAAGGFPKDNVVTDEAISKLQKMGIRSVKIRSPLTCESNTGMCAKCYGLDENGHIPHVGKRVGLLEIQAITERSVQLPMKAFHTGGTATGKGANLANAFDRALEIFRVPDKIKSKAELSKVNGMVQSIKKTGYGGSIVTINGKEHEIPPRVKVTVKVGSSVMKGQAITEGNVKPQELLGLSGLEVVQKRMRDDLHGTFASAGVNLNKRTFELPVKMITESVRIMDPGDCKDFVSGDYSTLAKVRAWNQKNPGKRRIVYNQEMSGMRDVAHRTDDWAQRMGLDRIQKTIQIGASQGLKSQRGNPFTDLALGYNTNVNRLSKKKIIV